jgi:hypothetical protein
MTENRDCFGISSLAMTRPEARTRRLLQDFVLRNDKGVVTNWSQKEEMAEGAKRMDGESLCGKEIAGAPGRTLLKLFPKKI